MFRRRISVEVTRALMRRSLTKSGRIQSFSVARRRSNAYLLRFSSSITDNNVLVDSNFQSPENEKENTTSLAGESLEPMTMTTTFTMGIPEISITRALKNEPDDEWDVIVEHTNSFHGKKISEEVKELQDDEETSESTAPKQNVMFYDWQWKIIGTARLLDAPLGSWTNEQWFSAESILFNGWSEQRCIRAVILQFALLRRACYEMEYAKNQNQQQQQHEQHTLEQQNLRSTILIPSPYNNSFDAATSSLSADGNVEPQNPANVVERNFGKKMLGRLISNWRYVYILYPDILRQNHLSPQELLDDVLTLYCGKYGIAVSEKVFRSILLAEITYHDECTPEFAEQVLGNALELYDTGMEDCFPPTPLWNYALLSWVNANRRQASSNGVARIVRLMDELKVPRSRQTYRILFMECIQRGTEQSARDAESYLRQMYKEFLADNSRVQPDMASFIYIADAWAKSKSPLAGPRAEQIYEQMKALRTKNHLLDDYDRENRLVTCVLSCYLGVGSTAAAKKAEDFYRRTGLTLDSSSFSALISIYAKHNDADGAERIWNELISTEKSNELNLNDLQFSASALLDAYAKARMPNKVEKAEVLFNWITKNSRINVDTPCYNAYLKVLMTDSNRESKLKALAVLMQMREGSSSAATKPNVISYTTVMNGWAHQGNYERASEVLRLMYDDYVNGNVNAKPDVMVYNTLLTAYSRSKDKASWTRAAALVEHMKKISNDGVLDIQPDVYSMSIALSCLSFSTDNLVEAAMKAEGILNEMRESFQGGNVRLQPNSYCYNNVMDIWARQGKPDKVEAIFLDMCKDVNNGNSAAKPITSTYNILLKSWAFSQRTNAPEQVEQIIEQMHASNVKPDVRSYSTLISCYGRSMRRGAPQKAEKVLRFMDELYEKGILKEGPTRQTFLTLRKAWEVSNEPDKKAAIELLDQEMKDRFHSGGRR